jgi:protein TonB
MRVASTAVSLTTHVIVVLAALWSTTRPNVPRTMTAVPLPPYEEPTRSPVAEGIPMPVIDPGPPIPPIDVTPIVLTEDVDARTVRFTIDSSTASGPLFAVGTPGGDGSALDPSLVDELPMRLAGPAPAYPDLLRQAGLQGRVVLEAVIDTLGRVERGSVVVVESAHPAFVAPAQQSLLKSLFRPARVRGKAVRVRVRVPIDFVLRPR